MSLAHLFPSLFQIASHPAITVAHAWEIGNGIRFQISFTRPLISLQQEQWTELQNMIMTFSPIKGLLIL
jgi:hypothetical protein